LNNIGLCRVKRDNADIGQSQPDAFPLYDVSITRQGDATSKTTCVEDNMRRGETL
jgi:hypothetical protein